MKLGAMLIMGLMLAGCATQPPVQQAVAPSKTQEITRVYSAPSSSALVFDTPITLLDEPLYLSRQNRSPGAFYGYQETTVDMYWVRQDDRYRSDGNDLFERRAISVRQGTSYR